MGAGLSRSTDVTVVGVQLWGSGSRSEFLRLVGDEWVGHICWFIFVLA